MKPEFILDKKRQTWFDNRNEFSGIFPGIQRQIENIVSAGVIFPHGVAAGRKEGQKYPVIPEFLFYRFYDGTALFEFAKGRAVNPYKRLRIIFQGVIYFSKYILPPAHKFARLWIEKTQQPETQAQKKNGNVVENFHGCTKIRRLG